MQHTACILLAGFVSVTIQFTHLITFAAAIEHIIFVFTCAIKLRWNSIYYYSYACCFHLWTVWAILAFNFFSVFFWSNLNWNWQLTKFFSHARKPIMITGTVSIGENSDSSVYAPVYLALNTSQCASFPLHICHICCGLLTLDIKFSSIINLLHNISVKNWFQQTNKHLWKHFI